MLYLLGLPFILLLMAPGKVIGGQQQFFKVKPHDKLVIEGKDEVEFECHVGNLMGQVQWSKDGFLLGYDPTIPGFLRYSMYVDIKNGVYNLRIKDVKLEDEADYQCQVSPGANSNQPIRAGAKLFVIIPPTKLIITAYYSNSLLPIEAKHHHHHHHRNLRVINANEGEKIMLKCRTSTPTMPVTTLVWLRNGVPVREGVHEKVLEEEDEDESKPSLLVSEATLHVYAKLDDQASVYKCKARHPGLGDKKVVEEVRLSVLYAPGKPEIEGYTSGSVLRSGDKLSLACISRGGNPLPSLNWYQENELVDGTYSPASDGTIGETTNVYSFVVKAVDNKKQFRCEAANSMGVLSSALRLSVHFPPVNVKINGPSVGRINDILRYECIIGPSNPLPGEINWLINGVQYYEGQYPVESWSEELAFGFMSRTNITVLLSESIKSVACFASSPASDFTASQASVNVHILYPPGEPSIIGYEKGRELREGEVLKLKCASLGGYPLPLVKWIKLVPQTQPPEEKEIAGLETKNGHSGVSSELLVRLASSDNGATYKCLVSNEVITQPLVTSVVLYPVYFASEHLKVKPSDGIKVKATTNESSDIQLECESGECYPYCNVTWYRNGYKVASSSNGGQEFEEKLSRSVGNFGGQKSISRLVVRRKWTPYEDGSSFTCAATNMFLPTKRISKSVALQVQYNRSEFRPSHKLNHFGLGEGISPPGMKQYRTKSNGGDQERVAETGPPLTIADSATADDSSQLPLDDGGSEAQNDDGDEGSSTSDNFSFFIPLSSLLLFSLAGWLICFALAISIVISRLIRKRKQRSEGGGSELSTSPPPNKVPAEYEVPPTTVGATTGPSRPASICVTTDNGGIATCKCVHIQANEVIGGHPTTMVQVPEFYALQSSPSDANGIQVVTTATDAIDSEAGLTCECHPYCNTITWYQDGYKVT